MMTTCPKCNGADIAVEVLERYESDAILGIPVVLRNAARRKTCRACGHVSTVIPQLGQLAAAVAMARALVPVKLTGQDLRLFRRTLGMTNKQFAETLDIDASTLSRWEHDAQGMGGASGKLIRGLVCEELGRIAQAIDYDPSRIIRMKVLADAEMPVMEFELVRLKADGRKQDSWDLAEAA
jgi:DNA-binding transcriptional regulator YiaG